MDYRGAFVKRLTGVRICGQRCRTWLTLTGSTGRHANRRTFPGLSDVLARRNRSIWGSHRETNRRAPIVAAERVRVVTCRPRSTACPTPFPRTRIQAEPLTEVGFLGFSMVTPFA